MMGLFRFGCVVIFCTVTTGCSGYAPIATGPGYFAIGCFRDHRKTQPPAPPNTKIIDLEGVGLAYTFGSLTIGYKQINAIITEPTADFSIELSRSSFAIGKTAERQALEITQERSPPPSPSPSPSPSHTQTTNP